MLLRKICQGAGGFLDGLVEGLQLAEKLGAVECMLGEHIDDLLNFASDDVSAGEVGVIKNGAEDAFRHEMLREHAFHLCLGEVRVDCVSALLMEVRERLAEGGGILTFGLDERFQFRAECGDGILKGIDSGIPFGEILLGVSEEGLEADG